MKKHIIITLLLSVNLQIKAQQTTIINQATFGGSQIDFGMNSVLNIDGSILISGRSLSGVSGDKSLPSFGSSDIWILKLNDDLSISWQLVLGGSEAEGNPVVISNSDGGYFVGVSSQSDISGNKTVSSYGSQDIWLVKIDMNGNIIWQNSYGGSLLEDISAIKELANGDLIVLGTSDSPISGNKTENSKGLRDYWILRIDNTGGIIWDKTVGGISHDDAIDLELDLEQNIIISGHSLSNLSGDKTENNFGSRDYWIVKLNSDGDLIWDKTIGGSESDEYCYITVSTEHYYFAGSSSSGISGLKSEPNIGGSDLWIINLDYDGNIIWDKTIGGDGNDGPSCCVLTQDHQLLLGCSSMSDISGHKTENAYNGSQDFWLVSLDTNGNFLWDKTIGGNGLEAMHSIHEKADNNYLLFGYSDSNISGDKDENSRGAEDFWIVEVSSNVGIYEKNSDMITLFPNPTSEGFRLTHLVNNLTILSLDGRVVSFTEKYNGEFISTENFATGIYFAKFEVEGINYSKKIVIQ